MRNTPFRLSRLALLGLLSLSPFAHATTYHYRFPAQGLTAPPPPPAYRTTLVNGQQSLAFGPVVQGTTSQKSWTFRNDGTIALTLTPSGVSAPFSLVSNTCSSVATGGSCVITVALNTAALHAAVTQPVSSAQGPDTLTGYAVQGSVVANGIAITNAAYGANWGLTNNRTTYVGGLCNGRMSCTIPAHTLYGAPGGGDPAPGKSKSLLVEYTCAGVPHANYTAPAEAGVQAHLLTCP